MKPALYVVLRSVNYKTVKVVVHKAVVRFVVDKGWTYQNDVVLLVRDNV